MHDVTAGASIPRPPAKCQPQLPTAWELSFTHGSLEQFDFGVSLFGHHFLQSKAFFFTTVVAMASAEASSGSKTAVDGTGQVIILCVFTLPTYLANFKQASSTSIHGLSRSAGP